MTFSPPTTNESLRVSQSPMAKVSGAAVNPDQKIHLTPDSHNEDKKKNNVTFQNVSEDHKSWTEKKVEYLRDSVSHINEQIGLVESQIRETKLKLKNPDAAQTVQRHIELLHAYNEMKDIGQGLLSLIADARGCRFLDLLEEYGLSTDD